LVADALEADWNERLRDLDEAQEEYERQRAVDQATLGDQERQRILELASDFPRLWRDPKTSDQQRKRMVRLLIEDVTLTKGEALTMRIRFKGGAVRELNLPRPRRPWEVWRTNPKIIEEIDCLLDSHTDREIAEELNRRGFQSGKQQSFDRRIISRLRREHQLRSRYDRLREMGKLTQEEIADKLGVCTATIRRWRQCGRVVGHAYNDKNECLYDPPGEHVPQEGGGARQSLATAAANNA
jgi:hypothetical protein